MKLLFKIYSIFLNKAINFLLPNNGHVIRNSHVDYILMAIFFFSHLLYNVSVLQKHFSS